MKKPGIFLATLLIAIAPRAASAGISLGDFNLITTGDVVNANSDVQGRVAVGGTLFENNFTFGGQLGNVPGGTTGNAGLFNALGSNVGHLNNNGRTFLFGSGGPVNGQSANAPATNAALLPLPDLGRISASYAALATNSFVTGSANSPTFSVASNPSNGIAVFSVDQSFFANGNQTINLSGAGNSAVSTIVINVTGTPAGGILNFGGGNNVVGDFNNYSGKVIYNFENETQLNGLNNLGGSILGANVALNTTATLKGSVYVRTLTNVGEIDLPTIGNSFVPGFAGVVPATAAVPEPAAVVSTLTGLGIAGLAALRRRRRA